MHAQTETTSWIMLLSATPMCVIKTSERLAKILTLAQLLRMWRVGPLFLFGVWLARLDLDQTPPIYIGGVACKTKEVHCITSTKGHYT